MVASNAISEDQVKLLPQMLYAYHSFMLRDKKQGTANSYLSQLKKIIEKDAWSPDSMATNEYIAHVRQNYVAENKASSGSLFAAAASWQLFWQTSKPDEWPEIPSSVSAKRYECGLAQEKGTELPKTKAQTVKDGAEPPKKKARTASKTVLDPDIDAEVEGMSSISDTDNGYVLRSCSGGWVVLPEDVDVVVLEGFSPRIVASGWACGEKTERRWTFNAGKDQVANLMLYANEGRLFVKHADQAVAQKVAELYWRSWLTMI